MKNLTRFAAPLTAVLAAASMSIAAEPGAIEHNPLRNAYFGETHMHTAFSLDAYIGGARLMPADALSYARGNPVKLPDGTVM